MIKRNEAKILVPIISAYAEGRILQYKEKEVWRDIEDSEGLSIKTIIEEAENYRIKPEYRPFKNAEECWKEMEKHQPFGWVKGDNCFYNIVSVSNKDVSMANVSGDIVTLYFIEVMEDNTFVDGTHFGVKVEE